MKYALLHGDCLEQLKALPDNSIDSIITDPPAGISFMGKAWDDDKGGSKQWITWMESVLKECLRALKPGAHGLVWAIPRTSHWTGAACEGAGFEIRDVVTHLFGSGFPKSMDISKAIDKAAGAIGARGQGFNTAGQNVQLNQNKELRSDHPDYVAPCGITDDAKTWQGWGTALKPACEMWWLIRKPCSEKTVAANVLKWGTGAINIDTSRIESIRPSAKYSQPVMSGGNLIGGTESRRIIETPENQGRFPSNLVLSCSPPCTEGQHDIECAIAALDRQSGMSKASKTIKGDGRIENDNQVFGKGLGRHGPDNSHADSGGASRFFYCAKASKSDKGAGNTHPTVKNTKLMEYLIRMITPPKGTVLDPFAGSGSTGVAAIRTGFFFLGIEQSNEYIEIAENRLANEAA